MSAPLPWVPGDFLVVDKVEVARADRYWIAAREDLPWLGDPDVEDGSQRHADRDEVDWRAIGTLLTSISASLADGGWSIDHDELSGELAIIAVSENPGLVLRDLEVLESFFSAAEKVCGDPSSEDLTNGRHRLWNIWKHLPDAHLPIGSAHLSFQDDLDDLRDEDRAHFYEASAELLRATPEAVARRSPAYMRALARAGER